MEPVAGAAWRTSTYSGGNGGNCVEAGHAAGGVMIRDTKQARMGDADRTVITFGPSAWRAFTASLKGR